MYLTNDIITEGNKTLREIAKEVKLPLSKENYEIAKNLMEYLVASLDDEIAKKFNLIPGVGIAAPQVGKSLRMFAVCIPYLENGEEKNFEAILINPKITAKSEEMVYLPTGEGCLSVKRDTKNLFTPRHERITIEADFLDLKTKKTTHKTLELDGYAAIVMQHEYDHLDGILYTDKLFLDTEIKAKPLY